MYTVYFKNCIFCLKLRVMVNNLWYKHTSNALDPNNRKEVCIPGRFHTLNLPLLVGCTLRLKWVAGQTFRDLLGEQ